MQSARQFIRELRHGWLSVTLFYILLTAVAYGLYAAAVRWLAVELPPGLQQISLLATPGQIWRGLTQVWVLFAWGFGLQLIVQLIWIMRRHPADGGLSFLVKRGAWLSLHAGVFEELVFRYYAFMAIVLGIVWAGHVTGGGFGQLLGHWFNPILNVITFGYFAPVLTTSNWPIGLATVLGALFFRSAHMHYGKFAKANVWVVGIAMFWLMFNYGLVTAMAAHVIYDACVFLAVALASPLQPRAKT